MKVFLLLFPSPLLWPTEYKLDFCAWQRNCRSPFFDPFFLPPPSPVKCLRLHSPLLSIFVSTSLLFLRRANQRISVWDERAPLNRKEVPVTPLSPGADNSDVIWIFGSACNFCLLPWIKFLTRSCPSLYPTAFTFSPFLPLLGEAWVLTHVVLTAQICTSVAWRQSRQRFLSVFGRLTPYFSAW